MPLFERLDARLHDNLTRVRNRRHEQPIAPEVVLIGIDDPTVEELGIYGRGPWLTRTPFEVQIQRCFELYKPRVLAFDILMGSNQSAANAAALSFDTLYDISLNPDKLTKIQANLQPIISGEVDKLDADVLMLNAELLMEQGDFRLLHALSNDQSETTTLLAYEFDEYGNSTWPLEAIIGSDPDFMGEDEGTIVPFMQSMQIPLPYVHNVPEDYPFYQAANTPTNLFLDYAQLGYINVPRDEGGIVRRYPLVSGMRYSWTWPEGHKQAGEQEERTIFLPSLAFLACLHFWGIDPQVLYDNDGWEVDGKPVVEVYFGEAIIVRPPGAGERRIPIDERGNFHIDFVGEIGDFTGVPFRAVVRSENEEVRARLADKIAFVGLTFTGAGDAGAITIHEYHPWVLVHMAVASNLMNETYLQPLGQHHKLMILICLWLILALVPVFARPVWYGVMTATIALIYCATVWSQLVSHTYLLPVTAPLTLMLSAFVIVVVFRYINEEREKRVIRGMFSTMVSPEVLTFMEENPDSFSLGGHEAEATMFFSDVAGFTTISESLSSAALVELLNQYLSPMSDIILSSGGYIDKYEGDAIMAEWGVPAPDPNHAKHACWSALEQQAKLDELRPRLLDEFGHDIIVRMGINSGRVSAGNMGSTQKFQYTVMGDAVNQAARYEPTNKVYGTLIMIGNSTYELAKDHIEARLLDRIVVKGKTVPIKVYELLAKKGELSGEKARVVERYHRGLALHIERRWEEAIACFEDALATDPDDGPSQTLLARVRGYQTDPPPDSWQGEYVRTSKD